jgi:hypothetical protein
MEKDANDQQCKDYNRSLQENKATVRAPKRYHSGEDRSIGEVEKTRPPEYEHEIDYVDGNYRTVAHQRKRFQRETKEPMNKNKERFLVKGTMLSAHSNIYRNEEQRQRHEYSSTEK